MMLRRFLYLNGLAIIAVVLFHSSGMSFVAMFAWSHRYLPATVPASSQIGSLSYYILRIIEQLIVFAIPAFLLVSGSSIATAVPRDQRTVSWQVVISRIKALIVPYLIWSMVVIVLNILQGKTYSLIEIAKMLLTGETSEVLYFIPLLIQFYLLSPFFLLWAKKSWMSILFITALLQLGVQIIQYPQFLGMENLISQQLVGYIPKWFFLSRIFWFPLGIVIGLHITQFRNWITRKKWWFVGLAIGLFVIGVIEWEIYFHLSGQEWLAHRETIIDSLYAVSLIFAVLAFNINMLPLSMRINDLGTKSYGIFLTHAIFIEYIARIIYHLAPKLLAYQLLFGILLFTLGLAAPLTMMAIFDKSPLRRWYSYLFG